jgi:hypothetical protein
MGVLHSPRLLDQRSLRLHELVAEKIRRDPALLERAGEILERWRRQVDPRTVVYLDEWRRLVASGMDECLKVAVEDSEHAAALRQSSPLSCLLGGKERQFFLKDWRRQHATE